GDTEGLKASVNQDKIPYISASFSGHLTDPSKTPYNFFVAPSYSDQLRAWLQWVQDDWQGKSGIPTVAFFYGDNAYAKARIEAAKCYCQELGVDLVDAELQLDTFQDATSQPLS